MFRHSQRVLISLLALVIVCSACGTEGRRSASSSVPPSSNTVANDTDALFAFVSYSAAFNHLIRIDQLSQRSDSDQMLNHSHVEKTFYQHVEDVTEAWRENHPISDEVIKQAHGSEFGMALDGSPKTDLHNLRDLVQHKGSSNEEETAHA